MLASVYSWPFDSLWCERQCLRVQRCSMKEDLADSKSFVRLLSPQTSRRRAARLLRLVRRCYPSDRVHSRHAASVRSTYEWQLPPRVQRVCRWSMQRGCRCCTVRCRSQLALLLVRTMTYVSHTTSIIWIARVAITRTKQSDLSVLVL